MDFVEYAKSMAQQCGLHLNNIFSPNLVGIGFDIKDYRITVYIEGFIQDREGELIIAVRSDIAPAQLNDEDGRIMASTIIKWVLERNSELDFGGYWALIEYENNEKGFVAKVPLIVNTLTPKAFKDAVMGIWAERLWFIGRLDPEMGRQLKEGLENS